MIDDIISDNLWDIRRCETALEIKCSVGKIGQHFFKKKNVYIDLKIVLLLHRRCLNLFPFCHSFVDLNANANFR